MHEAHRGRLAIGSGAGTEAARPLLLTGFAPFGSDAVNPSWEVASALAGSEIDGRTVVAAQLPTCFGDAESVLFQLMDHHRPALVLGLGQAGGRTAVSFERVAINLDDARIPDNRGQRPIDLPAVAGGPAAYFSTLPIKAMRAALLEAGIPAEVSHTAGTFVCNHVFYALMHRLAQEPGEPVVRAGFAHLPWLPGQGNPYLPLATMVAGIGLALRCALRTPQDLNASAGTLS